jgi:hypothetical protein
MGSGGMLMNHPSMNARTDGSNVMNQYFNTVPDSVSLCICNIHKFFPDLGNLHSFIKQRYNGMFMMQQMQQVMGGGGDRSLEGTTAGSAPIPSSKKKKVSDKKGKSRPSVRVQ